MPTNKPLLDSVSTSVSVMALSAASSALTKKRRVLAVSTHFIVPVNACDPKPGILTGKPGVRPVIIITFVTPFTLSIFRFVILTVLLRLFLIFNIKTTNGERRVYEIVNVPKYIMADTISMNVVENISKIEAETQARHLN